MDQLCSLADRRGSLAVLIGLAVMTVATLSDPGTRLVTSGGRAQSVELASFASRTGTRSLRTDAEAAAQATITTTGTPGTPCVRISSGRFDARGTDRLNLNDEFLVIRNVCANATSLSGWKAHDKNKRNVYRFPSGFRLGAGQRVLLHSGIGQAHTTNLYWGRWSEVWDNRSWERAYLLDPAGATVSVWPIAKPSATPTPIGTPAFGSRPASGAISLSNCSNVVIENKTLKDLGAGVIAIRLENCTNVTISSVDFINVAEGVYALNSTDVKVLDSRYSNIAGPAQPRTGANVANFVQFNNVAGGLIAHNKGKGGDTEDIVSVYKSSYVTVEDNQFEGTNWTSGSGSGIALGDEGGTGNVAQRNILVNPGQVGIFIAGGTNNKIIDNIIIGQQRTRSNAGVYVWNQSSSPCSGQEVSRNRVRWRNAAGASNSAWNAGDCGAVAGWSTNTWNATLDLARYRVVL